MFFALIENALWDQQRNQTSSKSTPTILKCFAPLTKPHLEFKVQKINFNVSKEVWYKTTCQQ